MSSFKDIQNAREADWEYNAIRKSHRDDQLKAVNKMVRSVLKDLQKSLKNYTFMDLIFSDLEDPSNGWVMSDVHVMPKFDALNNLIAFEISRSGRLREILISANEEALRAGIFELFMLSVQGGAK